MAVIHLLVGDYLLVVSLHSQKEKGEAMSQAVLKVVNDLVAGEDTLVLLALMETVLEAVSPYAMYSEYFAEERVLVRHFREYAGDVDQQMTLDTSWESSTEEATTHKERAQALFAKIRADIFAAHPEFSLAYRKAHIAVLYHLVHVVGASKWGRP